MHLTNVVLHGIVCALVAILAECLFQDNGVTAAISSMAFAVHPVHVESVTSVVGRAEPLCSIFMLLGFLVYRQLSCPLLVLRSHADSQPCRKPPGGQLLVGIVRVSVFLSLFVLFFALAVLSKETGVTLVAVCAGADLVALVQLAVVQTDIVAPQRSLRTQCGLFVMRLCLLALCFFMYISFRISLMSEQNVDNTDQLSASTMSALANIQDAINATAVVPNVPTTPASICFTEAGTLLSLLVTHARHLSTGAALEMKGFSSSTLDTSLLIRKSENPFKFLEGRSFVLSLMYLHARYARLLVFPSKLCCEYSFNCIPSVSAFTADENNPDNLSCNLQSLVLYLLILVLPVKWLNALNNWRRGVWAPNGAAPAQETNSSSASEGDEISSADSKPEDTRKEGSTWSAGFLSFSTDGACLIALGWAVIPFVPAAGVFVTVGTLLAERLLYMPSIGACLLLGHACVWISNAHKRGEKHQPSEAALGLGRSWLQRAVVLTILSVAAKKTFERTLDWETDKTLFTSALEVCPNSAKINQQYGQIFLIEAESARGEKLEKLLNQAETHFRVAQSIQPDFCDIDFNLGMMYAGRKDYGMAAAHFKTNLPCPYTMQKAFTNLQLIYHAYQQADPKNISLHKDLAEVMTMIENNETAVVHWREAGVLSMHAGKLNKALLYFQKALDVEPTRCDIRYWQGKTLLTRFEKMSKKKNADKAKNQETLQRAVSAFEYASQVPQCQESFAAAGQELITAYQQQLENSPPELDAGIPAAKIHLKLGKLLSGLAAKYSDALAEHGFSGAAVAAASKTNQAVQQYLMMARQYGALSCQQLLEAGMMLHNAGDFGSAKAALDLTEPLEKVNQDGSGEPYCKCLVHIWRATATGKVEPVDTQAVRTQLIAASKCPETATKAAEMLATFERQ